MKLVSNAIKTLLVSAAVVSVVQAADAPAAAPVMDKHAMIGQMVGIACPTMVAQLTGRPEMQAVLAAKPVNTQALCGCTMADFNADAKLKTQLNDPAFDLAKMDSPVIKSYTTVRLMSSLFGCLKPQLEDSLKAVELK